MKKIIYIFLTIALLSGAWYYKVAVLDKGKISTNAPVSTSGSKPQEIQVQIKLAAQSDVSNALFASGTLLPNETTDLRSETAGRITEISFQEGQFVRKGTLLIKINDADLQAQLQKNQHDLSFARENEMRNKKLVEAQALGAEEYDQIVNRVKTLEADAQYLQAQIAKTQIFAPFDGIVGIRQVALGTYVQAGSVIAPLRQTNPMKLEFALPEKYLEKVHKGQEITFKLEGGTALHTAKVQLIDPQIDIDTRSLRIRAICANPKGQFLSGSFAKVQFPMLEKGKIMVPAQAVVPTPTGKQVFVAKGGVAVPKTITTGLRTETDIMVEGLEAGDSVIVTGIMSLRPNAAIKVVE